MNLSSNPTKLVRIWVVLLFGDGFMLYEHAEVLVKMPHILRHRNVIVRAERVVFLRYLLHRKFDGHIRDYLAHGFGEFVEFPPIDHVVNYDLLVAVAFGDVAV